MPRCLATASLTLSYRSWRERPNVLPRDPHTGMLDANRRRVVHHRRSTRLGLRTLSAHPNGTWSMRLGLVRSAHCGRLPQRQESIKLRCNEGSGDRRYFDPVQYAGQLNEQPHAAILGPVESQFEKISAQEEELHLFGFGFVACTGRKSVRLSFFHECAHCVTEANCRVDVGLSVNRTTKVFHPE